MWHVLSETEVFGWFFFIFPWTCIYKCIFSCFSHACSKTTWDRSSATWAWRGRPGPRARSRARRCSSPAWCCRARSSPATSSPPRPPPLQHSPDPPSRAPRTPWGSLCSRSRDSCSSPCHRYRASYGLPRAPGKTERALLLRTLTHGLGLPVELQLCFSSGGGVFSEHVFCNEWLQFTWGATITKVFLFT